MRRWFINVILVSHGAWSILMIGHEIVGHGLATVLLGGEPIGVNGMYFEHDLSMLQNNQVRWIQASGSIFNILLGFFSLLFLIKNSKDYWLKYFLWITVVYNFLHSGAYIGFGRFIHDGMDWAMILEGVQNKFLWGMIETIVGLLLIAFGFFIAIKWGKELNVVSSSKLFFWTPLLASTTASVTSSMLIPSEDSFMMIMGGIGNGFLFPFPLFVLGFFHFQSNLNEAYPITKSSPIIILLSAICTCFYLFIMSPGLKF